MATWNSKKTVEWMLDTGFDYAPCENSWSYGTVSDFLRINTKIGPYSTMAGPVIASEKTEHYSKEEALALMKTLIDWAETYEGEGTVQRILEKRR